MKFPNKVNKYKNTVIYQMVEIADVIYEHMSITDLYFRVSHKMKPQGFYEGLSGLFALGEIELDDAGRVVRCLKK